MYINSFISTIYVPVFFILSGYLVDIKDHNLKQEIVKKVKTILRPFAIVYLFSFAISFVLAQIGIGVKHKFAWSSFMYPFFSQTFFNGPIWFLLALFWAFVLYYGSMKLFKGREQFVVLSTLLVGIVGFYTHRYGIVLPLFFAQGMVACPLLMMGSEIRKYIGLMITSNKWIAAVSLFVGSIIYLQFRQNLSFQSNLFDGYFVTFLFGVFGGSMAIICFSILLEKYMGMFAYWGKFSLVVLCFHNYVLIPSTKIAGVFIGSSMLWAVSVFVMVYMAFFAIIPLVGRFCPSLFNIKRDSQ